MTTKYILPALWASALINNDRSSLQNEDIEELDSFLSIEHPGICIDVSEAYFSWSNDATGRKYGTDVADFIFMIPKQ